MVVADVTSMYPTVFILQNLQQLLASKTLHVRDVTQETIGLLENVTASLYLPQTWKLLHRLVLIEPQGDILPVRMRPIDSTDPWTISIGPYTSEAACWYAFADVVASRLRTGRSPKILKAIEVFGKGSKPLQTVNFRSSLAVDPRQPIFKTIVEQRQRTKKAAREDANSELGRLDLGLKQFAASGAYGIFAEVNVMPNAVKEARTGRVYSDVSFVCDDVRDERPGAFANFIIASFVTAGARLFLSMLEEEVIKAGGTFAFCDTDSLAIVAGDDCPPEVPCLSRKQVKAILKRFDSLNPYDALDEFIKTEYTGETNLRCLAISAKRYVLFVRTAAGRIRIVKASESGLGAIIGRTEKETTRKLARRVWLYILSEEVPMNANQRHEVQKLCRFTIPLRRKLPLAQPDIFRRFATYNQRRAYAAQVKPFGFLQAMTIATQAVSDDVRPIAPFERDLRKSRKLQWLDAKTGKPLSIDWDGNGWAAAAPVVRLNEYIERYRNHPESKAAGGDGSQCTEETRGLLHPLMLESARPIHIGKEVDRLDEDDGTTLLQAESITYEARRSVRESNRRTAAELQAAIGYLSQCRGEQQQIARELGLSERRWRDIASGKVKQPNKKNRYAIIRFAREHQIQHADFAPA